MKFRRSRDINSPISSSPDPGSAHSVSLSCFAIYWNSEQLMKSVKGILMIPDDKYFLKNAVFSCLKQYLKLCKKVHTLSHAVD